MAQQIIRFNQESLNLDTAWEDVTNKPEEFTPESHQHEWSDITGEPDFAPAVHNHSQYAPASHAHPWAQITDVPTFIEWTPSFLYVGTASFSKTSQQVARGRLKILGDIGFFHFTLQGSIGGGSLGGQVRIGGMPTPSLNLTAYTSFVPLSACVGLNVVYNKALLYANNPEIFIVDANNQPFMWNNNYALGTALDIRGSGWFQVN